MMINKDKYIHEIFGRIHMKLFLVFVFASVH